MAEENEAPRRRISSSFLVIILVTLILSITALYFGIEQYFGDPQSIQAGYFMLIGFIGFALSAYMLLQIRRRSLPATLKIPKVITTLLCQECGFKNVRDFQTGDYIFKKTAEPCPKCNLKMDISSIYREVTEKEKRKGKSS